MSPQEYIEQRVDDQIKWLSAKSRWNQDWFKRLRLCELILAAAIPFLAAYADADLYVKLAVALVGVIIAILAGMLALYRFQELWIEYRATAEALKREKMLFETKVDPYKGDDGFERFVMRIEGILGAENSRWAEATNSAAAGTVVAAK
ncbi:MAG: DUF4231 domain-containing protein [Burkholderiales bacterium]